MKPIIVGIDGSQAAIAVVRWRESDDYAN